ncbi:hypothetical protein WDU94_006455, partial [Cyamophila willieti]
MWISPLQIKWAICFFVFSETVTSVSSGKLGVNARHDLRTFDMSFKAAHKEYITPQIKPQQQIYKITSLTTSINNVTKIGKPPESVNLSMDKTKNIGNCPKTMARIIKSNIVNIGNIEHTIAHKLDETRKNNRISDQNVKQGRKVVIQIHPTLGMLRKTTRNSVEKQVGPMRNEALDLTKVTKKDAIETQVKNQTVNCTSEYELLSKELNKTEIEIASVGNTNEIQNLNTMEIGVNNNLSVEKNVIDTEKNVKDTEKNVKDTEISEKEAEIKESKNATLKDIHKDEDTKRFPKTTWLQGLPMRKESSNKDNNMGEYKNFNSENGDRKRSANDTDLLLNDTIDVTNDLKNDTKIGNEVRNENEITVQRLNATANDVVGNVKIIIGDIARDKMNETNTLRKDKDEETSIVSQLSNNDMVETVATKSDVNSETVCTTSKVNDNDTENLMATKHEKDVNKVSSDMAIIATKNDSNSVDRNDTSKIYIETDIESKHGTELTTFTVEKIPIESGIDIIKDTTQIPLNDQQIGNTDNMINENVEESQAVVENEETIAPIKTSVTDAVSSVVKEQTNTTQAEVKHETSKNETTPSTDTNESQQKLNTYLQKSTSQFTRILENVIKNPPDIVVSTKGVELKTEETNKISPKQDNRETDFPLSYIDSELYIQKSPQSSSNLYKYNKPYSKTLMGYLYRRLLASTELTTLTTTTTTTTTEKPISHTVKHKFPTVILNFTYKKPVLGYLKNMQNKMSVNNRHDRAPKSKYAEFMGTQNRKNDKKSPETSYIGGTSLKKVRKDGKQNKKFNKLNRMMTNFEATLGNNFGNQTTVNITSEKQGDMSSDLWKQMEDTIMENHFENKNGTQSISNNGKQITPINDTDLDQTFFDLFNMDYLDNELPQPPQQQNNSNSSMIPIDEVLRTIMAMDRPRGDSNYLNTLEASALGHLYEKKPDAQQKQQENGKNNILTNINKIMPQETIANTTDIVGNTTENNVTKEDQKPKELENGTSQNNEQEEEGLKNLNNSTEDKEIPDNNGPPGPSQFSDEYAKQ